MMATKDYADSLEVIASVPTMSGKHRYPEDELKGQSEDELPP